MTKETRQAPDGRYSFIELRALWRQGALTLEEVVHQTLYTLIRFEKRRIQLDLKLLPYEPSEEDLESLQSYEALTVGMDGQDLLKAMEDDKKAVYEAMDFALDHFATLEMRFIQMERECEELLRKLDTSSSALN